MKERTLGNGATRLRTSLVEQHTREWMTQSMSYLSVLHKLRAPTVARLLSVYMRDAVTRLGETKARVTSVFGNILKMDSTKKMMKKLAGSTAGTAACVTNMGNEYGKVLMSVLTDSEGDGLLPMVAGFMRRKGPSSSFVHGLGLLRHHRAVQGAMRPAMWSLPSPDQRRRGEKKNKKLAIYICNKSFLKKDSPFFPLGNFFAVTLNAK